MSAQLGRQDCVLSLIWFVCVGKTRQRKDSSQSIDKTQGLEMQSENNSINDHPRRRVVDSDGRRRPGREQRRPLVSAEVRDELDNVLDEIEPGGEPKERVGGLISRKRVKATEDEGERITRQESPTSTHNDITESPLVDSIAVEADEPQSTARIVAQPRKNRKVIIDSDDDDIASPHRVSDAVDPPDTAVKSSLTLSHRKPSSIAMSEAWSTANKENSLDDSNGLQLKSNSMSLHDTASRQSSSWSCASCTFVNTCDQLIDCCQICG